MKWIHSKEKKPTVTGTYFGKYNGNELCFIYVAGGEVYKLRFTNTAEFSSGFRDMNKIEYEWLDESLSTEVGQDELWEKAAMELFLAHNPDSSPENEVNKRIINGFRKDMKILSLFFTLIKK